MAGGAWREKGFDPKDYGVTWTTTNHRLKVEGAPMIPETPIKVQLQGQEFVSTQAVARGLVMLVTAFMLGAAFATLALWLLIPYLPFAGGR